MILLKVALFYIAIDLKKTPIFNIEHRGYVQNPK